MFYYLKGIVSQIDMNTACVDCGGVGYLLNVSSETMAEIGKHQGNELLIYTYLAVREDAMELYGFADISELDMFKLLIGVSGIGPKVAIGILSGFTPERLSYAISTADIKSICQAPGVGKKTAERLVLELKDKVTKVVIPADTKKIEQTENSAETAKIKDVYDTLLALGYTRSEIASALTKLDKSKSLEDIIRDALKYMM